jgi:hypothetical protein
MAGRNSNLFFMFVAVSLAAFALMFVHAHWRAAGAQSQVDEKARIVERLGLTDLCLFTDARYARNPSMADLHTPFQDSPMAMEHFPSGTVILPPPHIRPQ